MNQFVIRGLLAIFTAVFCGATEGAKSLGNTESTNYYNLLCSGSETDIFVNTYSYELAIRHSDQPNELVTLETVLVEESHSCEECYDVTALLTENGIKNVVVAELRTKKARRHLEALGATPEYTVEMNIKNRDGSLEKFISLTPCNENRKSVENTRFEPGPNSQSRCDAQ